MSIYHKQGQFIWKSSTKCLRDRVNFGHSGEHLPGRKTDSTVLRSLSIPTCATFPSVCTQMLSCMLLQRKCGKTFLILKGSSKQLLREKVDDLVNASGVLQCFIRTVEFAGSVAVRVPPAPFLRLPYRDLPRAFALQLANQT